MSASSSGHVNIVIVLVTQGQADINAKNDQNRYAYILPRHFDILIFIELLCTMLAAKITPRL